MSFLEKILSFAGYAKKAMAAASSALIITGTALEDGVVTGNEVTMIVAAWTAVAAVFQLANNPKKG